MRAIPRAAIPLLGFLCVAPTAAQQPSPCGAADAPTLAVMVPASRVPDEFEKELREALPPAVRAALLPSSELPPLVNRDELQALVLDLLSSELPRLQLDQRLSLVVMVDTAGRVTGVRAETGDARLDDQLRGIWRRAAFSPARVGGCVVESVLEVPLLFVPDSARDLLRRRFPTQLRAPNAAYAVPIEAAVDLPALRAALRGVPAGRPWMYGIAFAANGLPDSVSGHILAPSDTTVRNPDIELLLRSHARRIPAEHAPNSLWLVVTTGSSASVRLLREEGPRLRNSGDVGRLLARERQRFPAGLLTGRSRTVSVSLVVNTDGTTSDIRVLSAGQGPEVESAASAVAAEMRFHPASIEGEPVKVRVVLPVTFQ